MNNQTTQLAIPESKTAIPLKESIQLPPPPAVIGSHNTPNYIFIPVMLILLGLGIWIYKKRTTKKQTAAAPAVAEVITEAKEQPTIMTTPKPVKKIRPKKKKSKK